MSGWIQAAMQQNTISKIQQHVRNEIEAYLDMEYPALLLDSYIFVIPKFCKLLGYLWRDCNLVGSKDKRPQKGLPLGIFLHPPQ